MATDASIPLGITSPMQNLSSLMGIAAQRQSINASQTAQQGQQIQNQNAGISLQERQNLQPILSDPSKWTDPNTGDADFNKLVPMVMQAAPTTGSEVLSSLAQMQQARTKVKQVISTQTDENNTRVASAVANLPPDATSDEVEKTFDVIKGMYPNPDMQNVLTNIHGKLQTALQNPDPAKRQFAFQNVARMFLPPQTQQDMASPALAFPQTQAGIQPFNQKSGVPGMPIGPTGPAMTPPNQLVPTTGGGIAIGNSTTGQIGSFSGQGGSNAGTPPQVDLPPGETKDTLAAAQSLRMTANSAAATVPQTQFNSNQIIKYADEADVGKGSQLIKTLGSIPGVSDATDKGTNLHVMQHYLTLQQSSLAQQAGLANTNAQTELAGSLSGTTDGTPESVKAISRVNRALSTGVALYNNGVEEAAKRGGPFAVRDFRNQWSSVADVNAMRLYDAKKNAAADPEGYSQVVKQLGGANSAQFKATLASVDKMRASMLGQ